MVAGWREGCVGKIIVEIKLIVTSLNMNPTANKVLINPAVIYQS
jgi:hypothetical protein